MSGVEVISLVAVSSVKNPCMQDMVGPKNLLTVRFVVPVLSSVHIL